MASDLSTAVVGFLRQHVGSIELLEVLLLLNRHRDRSWDADAVAAELRIQPRSAGARLSSLEQAGIIKATSLRYAFNADSEHVTTIGELDAAYQTHRVRIIEAIFSKPADNMRVFADAFVFRGKGPTSDG